jgi:hypothetical protein
MVPDCQSAIDSIIQQEQINLTVNPLITSGKIPEIPRNLLQKFPTKMSQTNFQANRHKPNVAMKLSQAVRADIPVE